MAIDKSTYLDENGYPGTRQWDGSWDGGDTAAIMGTVDSFDNRVLHVPAPFGIDGIPLRHPDTSRWYGQQDRFSRDQLVGMLCSCLNVAHREYSFLKAHKKKFFLTAWNTRGNGEMDMPKKFPDTTGPEVWALWLRILRPWWAKLVLPILDLETLINTFLWRYIRKDNVARNQMLVCLMIQKHSPTWVGWLAYKLLPWEDLLTRWENHCKAVGEYPTYDLFREAYEASKHG